MVKYIPKEGDIVYVDFNPIKGHEQSGERPALVISSKVFNQFTKMVFLCPISTNTKDFPTHYTLMKPKKVKGAVLCEHIRSVDYEMRHIKLIETCNKSDFVNCLDLIKSFFEMS